MLSEEESLSAAKAYEESCFRWLLAERTYGHHALPPEWPPGLHIFAARDIRRRCLREVRRSFPDARLTEAGKES